MKVLFDTNIWLDLILQRDDFYEASLCAFLGCIDDGSKILIAATSLKDIFYVACKNSSRNIAFEAIRGILDIANVCTVDEPICQKALELDTQDFEDGVVAACAIVEGADAIITRDAAAFRNLSIPCFSSEEFMAKQGWTEVDF